MSAAAILSLSFLRSGTSARVGAGIQSFAISLACNIFKTRVEILTFRDKLDTLLEEQPDGIAYRKLIVLQGGWSNTKTIYAAEAQRRRGKMTENEIGKIIVDAALTVHRALGPGLLELVYEVILAHELEQRGLKVQRQVPIAIEYAGIQFQEGFRADLLVEDKVIVELKSVEKVSGAHKKQVQTYLKLTGRKLGFLMNFNEELIKHGITRCVNGLEE